MHLTRSYRRRLLRILFGDQHAERSQRPDRDEVEVHQAGLAHRQAVHVGLGVVEGLSVHQEHHARGVQLEPHLLDDAIEIELQSGGNLLRQDRITLLGAGGLGPLADAQNLYCGCAGSSWRKGASGPRGTSSKLIRCSRPSGSASSISLAIYMQALIRPEWRVNPAATSAFHPTEPDPLGIANGRCGAIPVVRLATAPRGVHSTLSGYG